MFQIVVRDPGSLTGRSVSEFLGAIASCIGEVPVYICEVEGAQVDLVTANKSTVMMSEVVRRSSSAQQYSWGWFFFGVDASALPGCASIDSIVRAEASLQLADENVFLLFTTIDKLAETIKERYRNSLVEFTSVERGDIQIMY